MNGRILWNTYLSVLLMARVSGRGKRGMWVPEVTLKARKNPSLALQEALKYISWKTNKILK